ncbi:MAG TPA: hypothetical protein VJB92_03660 [Candidatus Paceibacterota bacterium]
MKEKLSWQMIGAAFILVAAAGLIQNTDTLNAFGIKPNLALAVLVALAFFITTLFVYSALVLTAVAFLRFEGGFELSTLVFAIVAFLVFWLCEKLPGKNFINNILSIGLATLVFYLAADPAFFINDTISVIKEGVYNIIIGSAVFALASAFVYGKKRAQF